MRTPTLHQAQAAFDDHDAFLYAVLGVASALRRVTALFDRAAAAAPERSAERTAGIPDGPALDALLGLVALKTTAEKVLGDMSSPVESTRSFAGAALRADCPTGHDGDTAPRVRRNRRGGLLR